ncbi:MAG: beta-ketoacyl-ACP synthase III [Candidatus Dormiibacterota bacterium]
MSLAEHVGSPWRAGDGGDGSRAGCRMVAVASALPALRISNADVETFLDTSDEWIASRTGIRERRIAGPEVGLLDLAARAARAALGAAGWEAADIDTVICSSSSPDETFPSLACRLQAELGCPHGPAFDIQAACSGALYGLGLAQSLIQTGLSRRVLIVSAELFSRLVDWSDRSTAVLFGDGAGAFLVGGPDEEGSQIIAIDLGADGSGAHTLGTVPAPEVDPADRRPPYTRSARALGRVVSMNGREVFRFSTRILEQLVLRLADSAGVGLEGIRLVVPHQANSRILATAAGRLGLSMDRFASNVERLGNTSSASVPLALAEVAANGELENGDLACLVAFGAGLTWGGVMLRWGPTAVAVDDPAAEPAPGSEGPELAREEAQE